MVFMPILVTFSRLFVISGELEICVQGRSPFCSTLIFFVILFHMRFQKKKKKQQQTNNYLEKGYQRQTDLELLAGAIVV